MQENKEQRIDDNWSKTGDKPGKGEEATKKTSRRDTPVTKGEKIENDIDEEDES